MLLLINYYKKSQKDDILLFKITISLIENLNIFEKIKKIFF